MCVLNNVAFSFDPDSVLERECKEWLDRCCKEPAPHDELKEVLHIGFAITKYGFERILDDRDAKRMRPSTPTQDAVDRARQQVQAVMEQQLATMRMDKDMELRQAHHDNDHIRASMLAMKEALELDKHRELEGMQKVMELGAVEAAGRLAMRDEELATVKAAFEQDKRREVERVHDILSNRLTDLEKAIAHKDTELHESRADRLVEVERVRSSMQAVIAQRETEKKEELAELRHLLATKDDEVRSLNDRLISNGHNEEVTALQRALHERDLAIATLENSNAAKGIKGENAIRDILLKNYPNYEVVDTSGQGAVSDLHLVSRTGDIIAVEVKYKVHVTNEDVSKSVRDIGHLKAKHGDKFKAYVFFSLQSHNIPKKGTCFEVINEIPVVWYGTVSNLQIGAPMDPALEKQVVNMMQVAQKLSTTLRKGQHDLQKATAFVNCINEGLRKNKAGITSIFNNANSLMATVKVLMEGNDALVTSVLEYMDENNIGTIVGEKGMNGMNGSGFLKCPHCNKECKSSTGLARHISSAHGGSN
jgi:hypothetical protein